MTLELRHLRYFVAIAEEGSFTRAAERLHIAQPPLSQQMRRLEELLGVTLIDRQTRPLGLTSAGSALLEHAHGLLVASEDAIRAAQSAGGAKADVLRTGCQSTPSARDAAFAGVAAASLALGATRFVVDEGEPDHLVERLGRGELDLAWLLLAGVRPSIVQREVAQLPFVLLTALGEVPSGQPVTLGTFATSAFAAFPRRRESWNALVRQACQAAGFEAQLTQVGEHGPDLSLVERGEAVALVPCSDAHDAAARWRLVQALTLEVPVHATLSLAWRQGARPPQLDEYLAAAAPAVRAAVNPDLAPAPGALSLAAA